MLSLTTQFARFCIAASILVGGSTVVATSHARSLPLDTVADVALAVDTSRFDYESIDPTRHLLFIAHLGASEVLAFDLRTRKLVAKIEGIAQVHGVLAVPELGRVYATATGSDEIVTIDADELAVIARAGVGAYPDGLAYASEARKVYVSNKRGASASVLDVDSGRVVASVALGGEVGNIQYDAVTRHVFANVQGSRELVEIDPSHDAIVARHPLPGADGNHGLLIDSPARLAFIACEDNDTLLVFDLEAHRVLESFALAADPDVLALDASLGLLYVASESGGVSMFKIADRKVTALARGAMGPNAHVVAVDAESHEAYFPLRDLRGRAVLRIVRPSVP